MAGAALPPPPGGAEEDAEVARRMHRALNARPARRGRARPREAGGEEEEAAAAGDEAEEVKVRAVAWPVKEEPEAEEEVKIRKVEWAGGEGAGPGGAGGGKRRRVKRERGEGAAEASTSGRGAGGEGPSNAGQGASRFRGVTKGKNAKAKPWKAQIHVTEDGKIRKVYIGYSAREEDAARAYDRVSIAKLGHAEATTNFPAAEYRAEWVQLEALGVDGAVALMKEHAAAERQDSMNKASGFRGVSKDKTAKAKPWMAKIRVTENGKCRQIHIATFAREEDAARAYDRVNIAKLGHAEADTNFPVADYRAEWAELEALGVEGAAALMREHAAAERADVMSKTSRFRGVSKNKSNKAKPWVAQIKVTEDGKIRKVHISYFAREEDAARAFDRVNIAKLGHAEAETNFPAADYRAEWAMLEALGVDGAAALMREHATAERPDVMNKASRFRGVRKHKEEKAKPWAAQIQVTEDGKKRRITIGYFAREEDAARAYDRVSIAKLGHAEAKTNFPAAEYRAEWAQLEALGVDGAVARERQRAK